MTQKLVRLVRLFFTAEQQIILDALMRLDIDVIQSDRPIADTIPNLIVEDQQGRLPDIHALDDHYLFHIAFCQSRRQIPGATTIEQPTDPIILANSIRQWLHDSGYESSLQSPIPGLSLIGQSEAFLQLVQFIHQMAEYDAPVLLKGKTGTGKEVAARAIHYLSSRQSKPFIAVNCGAYNDDLFIAELFGHERGAFTDAKQKHLGLVEQAQGGTLFLDEVDSLSLKSQVSLLRFMQDREFRPLGSEKVRQADVRLIAASNRPLEEWVQQGRFRDDLLFRLDILGLNLPTLSERAEDIPLLAEYFMNQFSRQYQKPEKYLHADTISWMIDYDWPGNIRELENYIHRVFLLSPTEEIRVTRPKGEPEFSVSKYMKHESGNCPKPNEKSASKPNGVETLQLFSTAKNQAVELFERNYIDQALRVAGGNIAKAARMAGKERRTFGRLVKKYGIDSNNYHR
ncbi:sigma-54 interaction domain-containing protein [Gynuella sp.]|uniref:sigma-54 interaction domain-containing protein n=1 Tax=Gynuella sp. TaxID=2969146 RepID=UPI003D0F5740